MGRIMGRLGTMLTIYCRATGKACGGATRWWTVGGTSRPPESQGMHPRLSYGSPVLRSTGSALVSWPPEKCHTSAFTDRFGASSLAHRWTRG